MGIPARLPESLTNAQIDVNKGNGQQAPPHDSLAILSEQEIAACARDEAVSLWSDPLRLRWVESHFISKFIDLHFSTYI